MRKHVCTTGVTWVQLFFFCFVDYTEMIGHLRHTLDHSVAFHRSRQLSRAFHVSCGLFRAAWLCRRSCTNLCRKPTVCNGNERVTVANWELTWFICVHWVIGFGCGCHDNCLLTLYAVVTLSILFSLHKWLFSPLWMKIWPHVQKCEFLQHTRYKQNSMCCHVLLLGTT